MLLLAQTQPTTTNLVEFLVSLIPWIIILGIILVSFRLVIRRNIRMTTEHIERMRQHMIAVESKLDRLVEQGERRSSSGDRR